MTNPEVSILRKTIEFFSPFNQPPSETRQRYEEIADTKTLITNWGEEDPEAAFLYIHGGGFSLCSPKTHANLMAHLAKYGDSIVYGPAYSLSPEHKFPTALAECELVYQEIRKKHPGLKVIVGGDSSGGNLAAALCHLLKTKGGEGPDGLVLLSAWLDLREDSASLSKNYKKESVFDAEDLGSYADRYCDDQDRSNPLLSPYLAEPDSFPPVLIQATKNELLFDDSRLFAEKLRTAGMPVTTDFYDKLFHAWHAFPNFMPEAKDALKKVGTFVKDLEKH
ncbi:alpha/beta hydrolase [Halocola ammonii]